MRKRGPKRRSFYSIHLKSVLDFKVFKVNSILKFVYIISFLSFQIPIFYFIAFVLT